MKHPASRQLYAYWNACRGTRPAPTRAEIEPGAVRSALGDIFILSFDHDADHRFRLAGTRICALFGRELRNEPFPLLWEAADRAYLRELITVVAAEKIGIIAGATGRSADGHSTEIELLMLPLEHRGEARLIGVLSPTEMPYWIGMSPIVSLSLGSLRYLDTADEIATAADVLVAEHEAVEARSRFTVYQGGRS